MTLMWEPFIEIRKQKYYNSNLKEIFIPLIAIEAYCKFVSRTIKDLGLGLGLPPLNPHLAKIIFARLLQQSDYTMLLNVW